MELFKPFLNGSNVFCTVVTSLFSRGGIILGNHLSMLILGSLGMVKKDQVRRDRVAVN